MRRTVLILTVALVAVACSPEGPAPRGGSDSLPGTTVRFAAVGDVGDGSERATRVAQAILREHQRRPLDALLLLGDLIYPDGDPREYEEKFGRAYDPLRRAGVPLMAVLGNHDVRTDVAGMVRAFGMPARFYAFTRGPVRFLALDGNPGRILAAQRRWLAAELARPSAPWTVAFLHFPLYSSGTHGDSLLMQQTFGDLFERHDVALVLAGHDHDYERTRPIRGVTYVTSGGGCCPRPVGASAFTASAASVLHFVVVEASAEMMTLRAVAADGSILDDATIVRRPAREAA